MLTKGRALMAAIEQGSPEPTNAKQAAELAKHTPGPWKYRDTRNPNGEGSGYSFTIEFGEFPSYYDIGEQSDSEAGWANDSTDYKRLAVTTDGCREAEANARLIAAAPDLLAACKAAVFGANHIDCVRAMQEVLPQIRAAVSRAEGGAK